MKSKSIVLQQEACRGPVQPDSFYDVSRYGNNGTITGATWVRLPSGLWTQRYDGASYVNIDNALTPLRTTTKGTWMCWVKLDDATPAGVGVLVSFGGTASNNLLAYWVKTTGQLNAVCIAGGAGKWEFNTDAAVSSDMAWVHCALTHNGVSPLLIVNGVAVAQTFTDIADKTVWFSGCTLDNGRIACRNYNSGGNTFFITNGNTVLVKLLNYTLTAGQIATIYAKERTLFGV